MNFLFGEKEERLRSEIREFVKENMPPDYIGNMFVEEESDEGWDFAMSMARKMAQKKWLVMSWPEEYGGMGASTWERVVLAEEAAYWGIPGLSMGISGTAWVGPTLMISGTKDQQDRFLPPIAAGEPDGVWCTGYSEPDAGSDLASLQTRAVRDGNEYIINGQKVWTSCAHLARWMWLICRTNSDAKKKHQGLSIFMVDMRSEGLTVNPLRNLVGGHVFNEVFFKDVRVPAENLVGRENEGWHQLMTALGFERGIAISFTASVRRKFDALVEYVKDAGLMSRPRVRAQLADLAVDIETARLLAYEPVCLAEEGIMNVHAASRDKANIDHLHEKLARVGTEILGAYSQLDYLHKDSKWTKLGGTFEHLYYYNVGMAIAAGTTYVQKNIVGQFGLQLPRSY
ncbi:MAG: acyl-CoA dehydrogenase family protein [Deltaproteobacteria bacterium]|nr:acyl-CoA dehydrogenase family protein [Deltaproteobacteria bacterium]